MSENIADRNNRIYPGVDTLDMANILFRGSQNQIHHSTIDDNVFSIAVEDQARIGLATNQEILNGSETREQHIARLKIRAKESELGKHYGKLGDEECRVCSSDQTCAVGGGSNSNVVWCKNCGSIMETWYRIRSGEETAIIKGKVWKNTAYATVYQLNLNKSLEITEGE